MGALSDITSPAMAGSASERHYQMLVERSSAARSRGDHQAAQRYATAAHKWAREEQTRLQRLAHAQDALTTATRYLKNAWDKEDTRKPTGETGEHSRDLQRALGTWERARDTVHELSRSPATEELDSR